MIAQTVENSEDLPLITFNSLYSLLREEKKTKVLLELPEKFYPAVAKFFEDKKNEIKKLNEKGENSKTDKEKRVIKSSQKLVKELVNLRLIKISSIGVKTAIFDDEEFSTENILDEEKTYLDASITQAKKMRKLI